MIGLLVPGAYFRGKVRGSTPSRNVGKKIRTVKICTATRERWRLLYDISYTLCYSVLTWLLEHGQKLLKCLTKPYDVYKMQEYAWWPISGTDPAGGANSTSPDSLTGRKGLSAPPWELPSLSAFQASGFGTSDVRSRLSPPPNFQTFS